MPSKKDLQSYTVQELKAVAKTKGIKGYYKLNKSCKILVN